VVDAVVDLEVGTGERKKGSGTLPLSENLVVLA
jgi:hypothetical protein